MDRDSVVVGGVYRTTDVTTCDLTYEPGSIVKVIVLYGPGCDTELLLGKINKRFSSSISSRKSGYVYLEELEELE